MSLFDVFNVAGSAMAAQSKRLNVVASNLANADSVTSSDGQPYKAKQVVFTAVQMGSDSATGVKVSQVVDDPGPPQLVYKPDSPLADAKGYVAMPNVNVVDEMVNMISATRAYQSNVDVANNAKAMLTKALSIGQ
jgi:flagellar basal-body rod protein FlgC